MKQVCKYLGYVTLVVGIIGSIIIAKDFGIELSGRHIERNWTSTFSYFIAGLFVTAVWTSLLLGISAVLESLESLKSFQKEEKEYRLLQIHDEDVAKNYWKCPQCGKSNPPYTGTCSCGQVKP